MPLVPLVELGALEGAADGTGSLPLDGAADGAAEGESVLVGSVDGAADGPEDGVEVGAVLVGAWPSSGVAPGVVLTGSNPLHPLFVSTSRLIVAVVFVDEQAE